MCLQSLGFSFSFLGFGFSFLGFDFSFLGNDGNYSVGDLSLREALALIADGGTINFANALSGGTITLINNLGQLLVNKSVTIDGDLGNNGTPDITVKGVVGSTTNRVFLIDDGYTSKANVTIKGLNITGGNVTGLSFGNGSSNSTGGGIFNTENLTLTNSTVSGNSAKYGGGTFDRFGTTNITNSTVSGNSATWGGGVFGDLSNTTLITNSTVSSNIAKYGGGIFGDNITIKLASTIV